MAVFDWAKFRRTKGPVRLHLLLDHDGYRPCFGVITAGKGHEVTVREMLDQAAAKVGESLKDDPVAEASLRSTLAQTYHQLSLFDQAATQNARAMEIDEVALGKDEVTRGLIRMGLFISFGYIGMIMAMRSNKEDFSLIIPYVRFTRENRPDNLLLLDTSVIIDGRIADLIEARFMDGIVVVPRFVLKELQLIADSADPLRRARGRRGLDMLARLQRNKRNEVKIHEAEVAEEAETDGKLIHLARSLNACLYTNDHNLGKIAELQSVRYVNLNELATALKPVILPGEIFTLKIVREGKDKGQGVGYLTDGTLIVVNNAQKFIGQQIEVQVISLLQSATGTMVFADPKVTPGTANGHAA